MTIPSQPLPESVFQKIFELSGEPMFILRDGKVTAFNDACAGLFGYASKDEAASTDISERISAGASGIASGPAEKYETTGLRKDGNEFPLEANISTFTINNEKYALTTLRDISDRKNSENTIKLSEERFKTVCEYSPNAICLINETGRIVWANDKMVEMGGYSMEQLCGSETFAPFIAPESLEFVITNFHKFALGNPYEHRYTFSFIRADGMIRTCEKSMSDIADKHGARTLVISMTDITERIAAEETVRRMACMLDTAPNMISVHDMDGNFIYANQKTFEMNGYEAEEFMKKNLRQIDVPASAALIEHRIGLLQKNGEVLFEVEHIRKDGSVFPLEVYIKLVDWGGRKAVLSIGTDITERRKR